jgi:hypothetical protein
MASIAISNASPSNAMQSLPTAKAAPAQTATTEKAPATLQPDTVKLSAMAQARMMHRSGQSATLIAATLGTNVATVDGYLNIKVAAQAAATPTPAAATQPEPAAQPAPTEQAKAATPAPTATPTEPAMTGKD